jgi:Flp pilus assembly protein TadG
MRKAALLAWTETNSQKLINRFRRDQSGSFYLTISALSMTALMGVAGLGTDAVSWYNTQTAMQSAADSGALSAATAYSSGNASNPSYNSGDPDNLLRQANAVTSTYGFVNGANGTVVTVNHPPKSGPNATKQNAVEVIIQQPSTRWFSKLVNASQFNISARSVALGQGGPACVLALNGAITTQGSASVGLNGCGLFSDSASSSAVNVSGNGSLTASAVGAVGGVTGTSGITATQGISSGDAPLPDPYLGAFSSLTGAKNCTKDNNKSSTYSLNPDTYCGLKITAGNIVTLNAGIYYFTDDISVEGNATLKSNGGVTLVFLKKQSGKDYATATFASNSTIDLIAPTSGLTAGMLMVMVADPNLATTSSFSFEGGANQALNGGIYLPLGDVKYAGGSGSTLGCNQLIANSITFTGNANFALSCANSGVKPVSFAATRIAE